MSRKTNPNEKIQQREAPKRNENTSGVHDGFCGVDGLFGGSSQRQHPRQDQQDRTRDVIEGTDTTAPTKHSQGLDKNTRPDGSQDSSCYVCRSVVDAS